MQIVSVEGCSNLTQNLMQIHWSICSVILNVMVTQYTCSLNGIYHPQLTSAVKSSLFTHVHFSPLSLDTSYINVTQTTLIILTMAGLFLDRPCGVYTQVSIHTYMFLFCQLTGPGNAILLAIRTPSYQVLIF